MTKAWQNLLPDFVEKRPVVRPRSHGLTMVLDRCRGIDATKDLLALTGDYVDQIKLSFGTSMFFDEYLLRKKIEITRSHQIDVYPGGTLMEAAVIQDVYPQFLLRAKDLGFSAVEISDGTINMPRAARDEAIQRALDLDLIVLTEVGKKDPKIELSPLELSQQILADLAQGAWKVIIEARESGRGIGIYDKDGRLRVNKMDAIIENLGEKIQDVIWEAPKSPQQIALITKCGPNVNIGNVRPGDVLGLEALRCGLRFETFRFFSRRQK